MVRMLTALALLASVASSWAGPIKTITDTQPIIDFPLCRCGTPLPAVLDFALFDFSTQPKLCSLRGLELTLTMQDGDTGPADFDFNNLSLALDGVNTGIKLNGFQSGLENSLVFSINDSMPNWLGSGTIAQILDKLKDGQLMASIVDATPNDNDVNLYSAFDTRLSLMGECPDDPNSVPEPEAILVWGVAGLVLAYRARSRKQSPAI
jgi:hypothetical protein